MISRLLILILSINFLIIQPVFAAGMGGTNTYKYYKTKNESPARCNTDHQAMCASMPNVFQASSNSCGEETKTCGQYMGTTLSTRQCTGQTPYGPYSYQDMYESALQFQEESLTCPTGHHLKLDGCNATCVEDNDCASKAGQVVEYYGACGSVTCPAGATISATDGNASCSAGVSMSIQQPLVNIDGCYANDPLVSSLPYYKTTDAGKSSGTLYCKSHYTYTGQKADPNALTDQNSGFTPYQDVKPRSEGGSCPDGYTAGEFGSGSNLTPICKKNSDGSGSGSCPTGQIRNNSGVCESTSTAGEPKKTTNNPDGSVTEEETKKNPDGSTAKTSTTTKNNPDGTTTKTTTTETTNAAGNKTSTTNSTTTPNTLPCAGGRPRNSQNLCPSGTGTPTGTCDPATTTCPDSGDGGNTNGGGSASVSRPASIDNSITTSWWKSSYPNGLTGVWQSHQADLNNTPFVTSLNQFKAGIPNSGSCPSFALNLGAYNGSISPPCVIWPFLRAVFLFSTMMLCRRIVFGG